MFTSALADIPALIAAYGYGLILIMVMLESLGLPLPGETTLITASIYAGATHDLTLTGIIAAAVAGAVIGDNIGFWIGEKVGYRLLVRFGPRLHITPGKIKLGQYLFMRHGGLRALCCGSSGPCSLSGRSQQDAVGSVLRLQRCGRDCLG